MNTEVEAPTNAQVDFTQVCEAPGELATKETLSMMLTRYHFAAQFVRDREILELACGAGCGLGYLAQHAQRVTGGDVDLKNLAPAIERYDGHELIRVMCLNALDCPFGVKSFDTIILLDSLYWLPSIAQFLAEVRRLLRPSGVLILSTVNPDWHGFNPSPQATRYYTIPELALELRGAGFEPCFNVGFSDSPQTLRGQLAAWVRKWAVKTGLVPNSIYLKEKFKRILYGPLTRFPDEVTDEMASLEPINPVKDDYYCKDSKIIYISATVETGPD
jgi:SAM-dependent methyltransferase